MRKNVNKPWLSSYAPDTPHDINPNAYTSLSALFDACCRAHMENIAFINFGTTITYQKLHQACETFASYLQRLGLGKGNKVAIMMPNLIQYPIALFGALKAGCTVVNVNPLYTADELSYQSNDAGIDCIVLLSHFAHTLEKALPKINIPHIVFTELEDCFPFFKRATYHIVLKYIKRMIPKHHIKHAVSFRNALRIGAERRFEEIEISPKDIAFLQYTGGTTGISKGAMLSHQNLIANVEQAYAWIAPLKLGADDIIITALPLYHIFSLTANCLTFLKIGAQNCLITNPRDMTDFLKAIRVLPFTVITGVNTLFNAMLHHPLFKTIHFKTLKLALSGGMALQKPVADQWKAMTGKPIIEAYGLTETSPAATINPLDTLSYNGSIGLPISSTNVAIRDENDKDVPLGGEGELCIAGPQVMQGYWNRPQETQAAFTHDGFFKTGDMVRMDDRGFVYIVDRKKDMIIVSGFNVYPNEVEQVISMHPGVLEVGVIGVEDPISGERVKACLVRRDPSVTEENIIAFCREHLTPYKVPKTVTFYEELPKTNVGKILRRALKDAEVFKEV